MPYLVADISIANIPVIGSVANEGFLRIIFWYAATADSTARCEAKDVVGEEFDSL